MKNLLYFLVILVSIKSYGQGFSDEKVSLSNFIKRMYAAKPFEGVKIVDDYDHQYLISVISLEKVKYTSESIMNRVAQVKAQSQASTFLNGATISMDMIITTRETKDSTDNVTTIVETVEEIKQNSVGFSQGLELLTNFDNADSLRMVFIYIRELKKE
jgi:6-pyruvoyl-tetrahydropterin synthase